MNFVEVPLTDEGHFLLQRHRNMGEKNSYSINRWSDDFRRISSVTRFQAMKMGSYIMQVDVNIDTASTVMITYTRWKSNQTTKFAEKHMQLCFNMSLLKLLFCASVKMYSDAWGSVMRIRPNSWHWCHVQGVIRTQSCINVVFIIGLRR